KMSKSLGNGVDPIEMSEKYGTDALRYFLSTNSAPGQDLRFETDKVESSWNFINKLWNIARFIMMNVTNSNREIDEEKLSLYDKYILERLDQVITDADLNYEKYEFGEVARTLYNFTWDEFASWYVEIAKVQLKTENKENTEAVLAYVLKAILKLMHPFMPFVTERIYQAFTEEESIVISAWPTINQAHNYDVVDQTKLIFDLISKTRNLRQEMNIAPSKPLQIEIKTNLSYLANEKTMLEYFLKTSELTIGTSQQITEETILITGSNYELYVLKSDIISKEDEEKKLRQELEHVKSELDRVVKMLSNENFIKRANPDKVKSEQEKRDNYQQQYDALLKRLNK
ncbi:MAG: class I tRNA ligase family protein, partial [Acholeplasmataceae bacterium]